MATDHGNLYAPPKSKLDNTKNVTWLEIYLGVLKKYAVFSGRARRKEYWVFVLLSMIVSIALSIIGYLAGVHDLVSNIYNLAVLVPSIAVGVRRLHDTNRRGWWLLFLFYNLFLLSQDSQPSKNRFGPDPKRGEVRRPSLTMERIVFPTGRSMWAIAAGYLALFSIFAIPAPAALFCGVMGLRDISKNPKLVGKPRAIFGIVMGAIGTFLLLLILVKKQYT
jgi:uncharacterized membrane protein YhaH (DUF805 family)